MPLVGLSLGFHGLPTRVLAPKYGGCMTFGAVQKQDPGRRGAGYHDGSLLTSLVTARFLMQTRACGNADQTVVFAQASRLLHS